MPPATIVPYKVAYVSSEDDGCPATELLSPGPTCRGWISAQYCIYPQEIILQLETRTSVEKIQLLAHNTMIPTSVDMQLGDVITSPEDADVSRAMFMALGEVHFSSNSDLKGRQLQTVELGTGDDHKACTKGLFIKLLLKRNHNNKHNEYNQVGLMGVSITGVPESRSQNGYNRSRRNSRVDEFSMVPRRQDLAFLMYTDKDVAELIHQLEERKYEAVSREKFENARKLKFAIEELTSSGQTLGALTYEKQRLADDQEYEAAKAKKEEVDGQREALYRELGIADLLELPTPGKKPSSPSSDLPPPTRHKGRPESRSLSNGSSRDSDADIPVAQPKRELPPPSKPRKSGRDEPTNLNSHDKKDLSIAIEVFGERNVANALNKSPSIKEGACENIKSILADYEEANAEFKPNRMLKGTTQIATRLIRDKMWAIFSQGVSIVNMLYGHFIYTHPVPKKDLADSSVKVYKELLLRCCDTNERVQDKAEDLIETMLANEKIRNLGTVQEAILQPLQVGKEHPKMALTRTELAIYLVDEMSDTVGSLTCMKPTHLAEYALSAVNQASAPVRKTGERLMLKIYDIEPRAVRKVMPDDTPKNRKANLNYKYLYDEFNKRDGRGGSSRSNR